VSEDPARLVRLRILFGSTPAVVGTGVQLGEPHEPAPTGTASNAATISTAVNGMSG
jgi:hypothetical protein